jgi:TRAP-type C4-dicarboxylate transport system permease small subunit
MIDGLLRVVHALLAIVRTLAATLLVGSVSLNFVNIIGRYFFRSSIAWAEEAMLFLMVGCVFLGSGPIAWSGRHVRMDVFIQLMPAKLREALVLFAELTACLASFVLVIFSWPTIRQLYAFDQRSLAAEIPLFIPQGVIPLGLAIMALLVACRLITGNWRSQAHTTDH